MNVSRAAFLRTPGKTVIRGFYVQTDSPTLSSVRTRWLELAEWTTFPNDCELFWQSVSQEEKDELLFTIDYLRLYNDVNLAALQPPTNEDMLSAHLDARYSNPHNWVITPSHSKIIRRDDGYGLVGKPDYLFIAQNAHVPTLHAVMELKTFWKVTDNSITELLDGQEPRAKVMLNDQTYRQRPNGPIHPQSLQMVITQDDWQWSRSTDTWSVMRRSSGS
jgi:hypothetical protein